MKDKSPSLEVISNDSSIGDFERRLLPRLSLGREQFRVDENGRLYSVIDLSHKGMAIQIADQEDLGSFVVGFLIQGTLNLKREKFHVSARVRNLSPDRIGFEFENLSQEAARAIQAFTDPAVLGAELKPIPAPEMGTLWYHGPSGTDLFLERSTDGQYQKWILYVLGSFIRWENDQGVSTGRVKYSQQHSEPWGILRKETLLLESDPKPDSSKLAIAKTVILSSNLPQELKAKCVRQLEK